MTENRAPDHEPGRLYEVPARSSRAIRLSPGQTLRIVNTHGSQVVDTWAVALEDPDEVLSMQHTRAGLLRLCPQRGDAHGGAALDQLVDDRTADTAGGTGNEDGHGDHSAWG